MPRGLLYLIFFALPFVVYKAVVGFRLGDVKRCFFRPPRGIWKTYVGRQIAS